MRARIAAFAAVVALASLIPEAAGDGAAPERRVLVIPLAGQLPGIHAGAPVRMSGDLVDLIGRSGPQVVRAPADDVLGLVGCAELSDHCLVQALDIFQVSDVVAGDVAAVSAKQVRVRLRLARSSRPVRSKSFLVPSDTPAALEAGFRARAAAFWRDPDAVDLSPAQAAPPAGSAEEPRAPVDSTVPGFSAGRVSGLSWALAGSGVGLAVLGGLALVAAADKQADVDDAPTDTVDDLEALADIEKKGRRYARWGAGLLIAGAAATTAGVVLIVVQGTERMGPETDGLSAAPRSAPGLSLTLAAPPGGVGAILTVQARR